MLSSQTTQSGTTCGALTAFERTINPWIDSSSRPRGRGRGLLLPGPHRECPLSTGVPQPASCARSPPPQPTNGRPALAPMARKTRLALAARRSAAAMARRARPHARKRSGNHGARRPHTTSSSSGPAVGPLPTGRPKPTACCGLAKLAVGLQLRPRTPKSDSAPRWSSRAVRLRPLNRTRGRIGARACAENAASLQPSPPGEFQAAKDPKPQLPA